ncbi:flagellin [Mesorhizobium sp. BAC0120]|uniref:flagellin N-terminal helical domain-containing protein n=1 Tax=Mesorhizobium sp. BAC0120 TaxID=3090670 RepID=UPI00298CC9EC|nr:flagellin [Mesorhizobium sp. BAC0120]MDW6024435.1 flagellin [Mesorhizobium sp. BAC0120]
MSSLLTNSSAMTALQTLTQINKDLATTQGRISTGQKVSKAADNAAYWSIATTMRSDNEALGAVQEALGLGASKVDTAYSGMDAAINIVKEIKKKLVTAQEPSADKAKIQGEISQLQEQLKGIVASASFSGENWLTGDATTTAIKTVVGSFVRDSSGGVSIKTIDYTLDSSTILIDSSGNDAGLLDKQYNVSQNSVTLKVNTNGTETEYTVAAYTTDDLIAQGGSEFQGNYAKTASGDFVQVQGVWVAAVDATTVAGQDIAAQTTASGTITAGDWAVDTSPAAAPATNVPAGASILDIDLTNTTQAGKVGDLLKGVDAALKDMASAAASLGSISSRIDMQNDFISKLTDSLDRGIGRLVDADMEEESARLSALQVQQQLGIQSLSIANSNAQNILSLFRQ